MEITMEMVTMVVTAIITYLFGFLAKKFNWETKDYIPFQNLCVGLFTGLFVYLLGINNNLLSAVILGLFASMTAGGLYDLGKIKKGGETNDAERENNGNSNE